MRHYTMLIAATAIVLSTAPAYADLGDQLSKLLPKDGAFDDNFGNYVAMSGTTAIVGAWHDSDQGSHSGSAYLFNISDPTKPIEIFKLLPNDGQANRRFGISVGISDTTAIVGASLVGGFNMSAYLFDTTTGLQIAKLQTKDGVELGRYVGISGSTAIVGAPGDDDNGEGAGSAYLFETTTGKQLFKLLPDDGKAGAGFGWSVAISDTTAIVGAREFSSNGNGSAYLFDTTTGQQLFKLVPDDETVNSEFGKYVAISGTTAIVGAVQDTNDNGEFAGAAYLFDTTTGQQLFKLLPDDGAARDFFGNSVAISGKTAIVGAFGNDDHGSLTGSAYLFDTTTGQQIFKLLADDKAFGDRFGTSVAISDAIAIVGAKTNNDNGSNSGSAYLFDAAINTCPWDLDNTGSVGTGDLLELFAQWGTAGPADFDGNGTVNTTDLLILFANWGPCP